MAAFTYEAINAQGLESSGVIHAPDTLAATELLQARGLLPRSLAGRTLEEGAIESRTGLTIVAIQQNGRILTNPAGSTQLTRETELVMLGSTKSRQAFAEAFPA